MSSTEPPSPLEDALGRVGDRWSLLLVDALLGGPRRFGELQEGVGGIATNVLAQRLRHLEGQGVVLATPYQWRPVRYVYDLTAPGRALASALRLLAQWGADHGASGASPDSHFVPWPEAPAHAACGGPLETRWYCPTCDRIVDEREMGQPPFV